MQGIEFKNSYSSLEKMFFAKASENERVNVNFAVSIRYIMGEIHGNHFRALGFKSRQTLTVNPILPRAFYLAIPPRG